MATKKKSQSENPHQGRNIKWFRKKADLTQEELAKLCGKGIEQRNISTWERLEVVDPENLKKVADGLKIDICWLTDYACYEDGKEIYFVETGENNANFMGSAEQQGATYNINPLEVLKQTYDENIARLIEAHNRASLFLEKQNEQLMNELKEVKEENYKLRNK